MALPFFEDVTILLTILAICSLIAAQILFPYRNADFSLNKKRFAVVAQLLGIVAVAFLAVNAYLIIYGSMP